MKRKNRTVCAICGEPLTYGYGWRWSFRKRCPHGKRKITFPRRAYTVETIQGQQYEYWRHIGRYGIDILDVDWRKKLARKHAKRAGVRKKLRLQREKN